MMPISVIRGMIILAVTASSVYTQSAALLSPEDLGDLIDLRKRMLIRLI